MKQITSPGSTHETGCSELMHWDDPEGWDAEGRKRGVQDGEHMYTHGGFMSIHVKKTKKEKKKHKMTPLRNPSFKMLREKSEEKLISINSEKITFATF